jgi:hypothetical protein
MDNNPFVPVGNNQANSQPDAATAPASAQTSAQTSAQAGAITAQANMQVGGGDQSGMSTVAPVAPAINQASTPVAVDPLSPAPVAAAAALAVAPALQADETTEVTPQPTIQQPAVQLDAAGMNVQPSETTDMAAAQPPAVIPMKLPPIVTPKPQGPSFFGYKPPKWAFDFDYIRSNKGKGESNDSKTWLLYMIDRLLKKHSL